MSRILLMSLTAASVFALGCQQAKMSSVPQKPAQYSLTPSLPPTQFEPPPPPPLPGTPPPVRPVQPLPPPTVVAPPPTTVVTPVEPVLPSTPPPTITVTPSDVPLEAAPPPQVITPPAEPLPPPSRTEIAPSNLQEFNKVINPPARPLPQKIVEPAAPAPQVIEAPPPPRSEVCVGAEGAECKPPKAEPDQCKDVSLKSDKQGKLDVLFVVDTSLSLRGGLAKEGGELAQLAREMENFVSELPLNTDIRIAVMLAHGPASKWHGRLFNAGRGDQTVIRLAPAKTNAERAQQSKKAGRTLTQKMIKVANDKSDAQGEAMLLSLYSGIMNKNKRAETIKAGMFREDAALNVMIVSDEQDVCFDYEAANQASPGLNAQPRKKKVRKAIKNKKGKITSYKEEEVVDPYETRFFNKVCKKAVNGQPLTPGHVYQALQSLKQDKAPLILTGLAYKSNDIPVGLEDENEMGHGIIDLVEHLAGGQVVDLGKVSRKGKDVSFAKELVYLGKFAFFKITYNNEWSCASNTHPAAVNKSSVKLTVLTASGEPLATFSGACDNARTCDNPGVQTIIATGGQGGYYNKFRVNHEQLSQALEGKNTEGAKVRIEFVTRTDVDRTTGNKLTR